MLRCYVGRARGCGAVVNIVAVSVVPSWTNDHQTPLSRAGSSPERATYPCISRVSRHSQAALKHARQGGVPATRHTPMHMLSGLHCTVVHRATGRYLTPPRARATDSCAIVEASSCGVTTPCAMHASFRRSEVLHGKHLDCWVSTGN